MKLIFSLFCFLTLSAHGSVASSFIDIFENVAKQSYSTKLSRKIMSQEDLTYKFAQAAPEGVLLSYVKSSGDFVFVHRQSGSAYKDGFFITRIRIHKSFAEASAFSKTEGVDQLFKRISQVFDENRIESRLLKNQSYEDVIGDKYSSINKIFFPLKILREMDFRLVDQMIFQL